MKYPANEGQTGYYVKVFRMKKTDKLFNDGSISSCILRFVFCFALGLMVDVIIFFTLETPEAPWIFWSVYAGIPVVMGILGVFAFNKIVGIYDSINAAFWDND